MPKISVIIPTYNRINSLLTVLKKLENQDFKEKFGEVFEVIVVNDGSTDGTEKKLEEYKKYLEKNKKLNIGINFDLKILFQENKKQGTARNFGVKNAKSDLILFLQDDIFPEKNLISEHYFFHKKNFEKKIVAIGKTIWNQKILNSKNKNFYEFLDGSGKNFSSKIFFKFFNAPLFNYEKLENKKKSKKISENIFKINSEQNFSHFYTNNLSMKKNFYLENGGFNEEFSSYGWEDIEFGYRLKKSGMELFFLKNALAEHNHEYNLEKFLKREKKVAKNLNKFLEIQPELKKYFISSCYSREGGNLSSCFKKIFFKILSSDFFLFFGKIFWKNFYWYFLGKKEILKNFN